MDKRTAVKTATNYINFLVKDHNITIAKAYLFGSYAKGNYHKDSDIDIALVMPDLKNSFEMQVQLMMLRSKISIDIEPHPFNTEDFTLDEPVVYEILTTGIPLKIKYQRKSSRKL